MANVESLFNIDLMANYTYVIVNKPTGVGAWSGDQWLLKEIELMQWTGLKDALGKDVYAGDIIYTRHKGHAWKGSMYINQNIKDGRWELAPASNCQKNARIFNALNVYEQKLEVVGSIYENPELLEKK